MSKVDRLICHVLPKAFLMALVGEGRLLDLQIVRRDSPSRVEGVFLGRLERVMPDLDAAFVSFLSGSYSNVVGLPLFETLGLLKSASL